VNKGLMKLKDIVQIFLILAVLIVLAFIVMDGRSRLERSNTVLAQEQANLASELVELDRTQQELQYINSDAFFERILRRNLGMVRPDEIVYVIVYTYH